MLIPLRIPAIVILLLIVLHSPAYSSDYDIIRSFPSPGPSPKGLAWDGEYLWNSDNSTDTIYKLNPSDGSVVSSFDSPGSDPRGLTWDGEYLWAVEGEEITIYKLNPADGDTLSSLHPDIPLYEKYTTLLSGLAWDGSHFFYSYFIMLDTLYSYSCMIQRINPVNSEIDEYDCFDIAPDLTYDGTYLWHSKWNLGYPNNGIVKKREMPYYKPVVGFLTPGYSPTGLTWDGNYFWLADDGADSLYQIEVKQTEVEESLHAPVSFELYQNYPNPFNLSTTISYSVHEPSHVLLIVYDITGRKINQLVNQYVYPGHFTVNWNAVDDKGTDVSSGVYFSVIKANKIIDKRKMLLMK